MLWHLLYRTRFESNNVMDLSSFTFEKYITRDFKNTSCHYLSYSNKISHLAASDKLFLSRA